MLTLLHPLAQRFQYGVAQNVRLREHVGLFFAGVVFQGVCEHPDFDEELRAAGVGAGYDRELIIYLPVLCMRDAEQRADLANRGVK